MYQDNLVFYRTAKRGLAMALIASTLSLAACGETRGERFVSGALIGTGVALGGGAIMGWEPMTSAIIGASVGGVAGGISEKSWDKPWYRHNYWPWEWELMGKGSSASHYMGYE